MSKKRWISISIILVILVVLALPKIFEKPIQAKKGGAAPAVIPVSVHKATYQTLQRSTFSNGNILADEEIVLQPEIQARVLNIYFDEGADVKRSDLLVKLNDAEWQAQLKRAQSSFKLKQETEKRNKQLLQKGAMSQEAYDQSLTDLQMTEAEIDLLKEQIRKTELRAPFNGTIGLRSVSEGMIVNPSTNIASIQKLDKVKVEFTLSEKYAALVKKGMNISFTVDAQRDTFRATVYAIEPRVDDVTRNLVLRARCDNSSKKLIPGAFARVHLPLSENKTALMIPTQSVVPILKGQKVFVVMGDSIIEKKVSIGTRTDSMVEVISGLEENDAVVVKGVIYMRPGIKVKIENN